MTSTVFGKVALANELDVSPDDLDETGNIKEYALPTFEAYSEEEGLVQTLALQSIMDGGPGPTLLDGDIEIKAGWCPGGSWSGGVCKPFNNNRTHWMSTYGGVRNLPIHMAILPGTHNSGFDKKASSTPSMEVCQDVSPHEQLNGGIRVLDIRVHHYSGYPLGDPRRFMIFHKTTNGRTIQGDIINGIKHYHKGQGWDRRREIVIVDFHEFRNFTSAAHAELARILKSSLGSAIISPAYKELTISQLWGLPGYKNVVVAYKSGSRDPSFWPGVNQRWIGSNTPSDSELKKFVDRVGSELKSSGELRSIQAARMTLPFFVPKDISGSLMSWFAAGSASHPIMKYYIINSDWSLRHRLVDNIIHSNQFRARFLGMQDVQLTSPGDIGVQGMPSARHMTFTISDTQWSPVVALPPILDEEPHRLLVLSEASADFALDMGASDVPMERVRLSKGDAVALVCLDGSRRWKLQVRDCTPNDCGYLIPAPCDGEKFVRYTLSHDNFLPSLALPASAPANSMVLVVSNAPSDVRIYDAKRPDEAGNVILFGETYAFIYDADTDRWSVDSILTHVTAD